LTTANRYPRRNAMTIPGFSAEAAIGRASGRYRGRRQPLTTADKVTLADWVDQACVARCLKNCSAVCAGTSGPFKAACIAECRMDNAECRSSCTRPGNPPDGDGSGGSGNGPPPPPPCTPCGGFCCRPGTNCASDIFSGTITGCCQAPYTRTWTGTLPFLGTGTFCVL
jgi:hypothetical protein